MTERERWVSPEELFEEFSGSRDWLEDHNFAQYLNSERILSAEEKVDDVGGAEKLRELLDQISEDERPMYLVLLACRNQPMVGYEIIRLADSGGYLIGIPSMYRGVQSLRDDGFIEEIPNIDYVSLRGEKFKVTNRDGFLTTEHGLRRLAGQWDGAGNLGAKVAGYSSSSGQE